MRIGSMPASAPASVYASPPQKLANAGAEPVRLDRPKSLRALERGDVVPSYSAKDAAIETQNRLRMQFLIQAVAAAPQHETGGPSPRHSSAEDPPQQDRPTHPAVTAYMENAA